MDHLGVEVEATDQVTAATARLKDAGLATFEENDTSCCYALQDKVWVHGPGKEPWEVYVVKADADTLGQERRPSQPGVTPAAVPSMSGPPTPLRALSRSRPPDAPVVVRSGDARTSRVPRGKNSSETALAASGTPVPGTRRRARAPVPDGFRPSRPSPSGSRPSRPAPARPVRLPHPPSRPAPARPVRLPPIAGAGAGRGA